MRPWSRTGRRRPAARPLPELSDLHQPGETVTFWTGVDTTSAALLLPVRSHSGYCLITFGQRVSRQRMSAAGRKAISARMKKYWADRRKTKSTK